MKTTEVTELETFYKKLDELYLNHKQEFALIKAAGELHRATISMAFKGCRESLK